jgi:hypothetical protein
MTITNRLARYAATVATIVIMVAAARGMQMRVEGLARVYWTPDIIVKTTLRLQPECMPQTRETLKQLGNFPMMKGHLQPECIPQTSETLQQLGNFPMIEGYAIIGRRRSDCIAGSNYPPTMPVMMTGLDNEPGVAVMTYVPDESEAGESPPGAETSWVTGMHVMFKTVCAEQHRCVVSIYSALYNTEPREEVDHWHHSPDMVIVTIKYEGTRTGRLTTIGEAAAKVRAAMRLMHLEPPQEITAAQGDPMSLPQTLEQVIDEYYHHGATIIPPFPPDRAHRLIGQLWFQGEDALEEE